MVSTGILSRIGSVVSLPLALILLILFFVPWVNLTCSGQKIGSATGLQLAAGKMTEEKPSGDFGMTLTPPPEETKKEPISTAIKARPWFFLCLVLPVAALLVGLLREIGRMPACAAGGGLILLGVLGLVMMIMAGSVNYSDEIMAKQKEDQARKPVATSEPNLPPIAGELSKSMESQMEQQMKEALNTEPTGAVWTCLVLYILLMLCGAANLLLPKARALLAAQAPPQPPPPASPPAQT